MALSRYAPFLALVLLMAGAPAGAQTRATTADLGGIVVDQSSAVVPGVRVTASNRETGVARTVETDDKGRFSVPALQVGVYEVRAELSGFAVEILDAVTLRLGSSVDVTITLRIAPTEERVTVVAARSSPIDVQKTMVGMEISQRQIETLPINRRNFVSAALITPGANVDRGASQGIAGSSGLSFAGQRGRSNNITVDGLDNNDATTGSVRATFSQEAVREFQVLTNSYSAEFGKASGGVLNIVTRSGTNTLAGRAFAYLRDSALDWKGYFERFDSEGNPVDRERGPFTQVQAGAIVGGPIKKDKTFFFAAFERFSVRTSNLVSINETTIVADPRGGPPLGTPADILRRAGFPVDIGQVPLKLGASQFLAKVDHQITSTQHLDVRFNAADLLDETIEPWGGLIAKSRGAVMDAVDFSLSASHSSVPSSALVNEARFQFAYRDQRVDSLDPACPLPCEREDQGGPAVSVAGVGFVGRHQFTPQPRAAARYQALDTLSYFRGNHQLKTGFDFNYIDTDARLPLAFGAQYQFGALPAIPGVTPGPISAVQALALGLPVQYTQGFGNSDASYPYTDLSLFLQDEWRVRERLTLKTGLRYQAQFWPDHSYEVAGLGRYDLKRDLNNLAPRLSAAWAVTEDRSTLLRGAYGIFYDNTIGAVVANSKAINGRDGVRILFASLPSQTPISAWSSPGHRLAAPPASFASQTLSVDPELKTAYAHHASAGIDRRLPGNIALAASFVYARGLNHVGIIDYNPLVPELGPGRRPDDINGRAGTSSGVSQYTSYAGTWYRGLVLSASKRVGRYEFLASYTLSKAEDNATDYIGGPQNNGKGRDPANPRGLPRSFNPDDERARSISDQRHRFNFNGVYVAPWSVQLSTVLTVGSGLPYDLSAGTDFNGDGYVTDRPRGNPRSAPSDYSTSVPRNQGTLPGLAAVDVRVQKRVRLYRAVGADLMFEVFNLFNRTNFTSVNPSFGPGAYPSAPLPTFGQFTRAGPPRQIQLAARIVF